MFNTQYFTIGVGTLLTRNELTVVRSYAPATQHSMFDCEHSVLSIGPFDLHVLGTPPAFILSQDQTLRQV